MNPVEYLTATGQTSFTVAAPVGLPVWENPFPEQSARLVFRQRYWQRADSWAPVTLNTAFDYPGNTSLYVPGEAAVSFYLVGEDNFQDQRGGILVWDRTYAQVPANRYDYLTYPYEFPAIAAGISLGAYTSVGFATDVGGGRMFISYTAAAPGNQVALGYTITLGAITVNISGAVVPVFDYASGGLIVAMNSEFMTGINQTAAPAVGTLGRQFPLAAPGRAVVSFGYFLATPGPTFNITPVARQKFTLNGEEVNYVSANTVPSAVSYLAMITTPSYFVAENEQVSRWLGNIYERKVIYVYAQ